MEASAGLVAGTHHHNELIVIRCHGDSALSSSRELEQSSGRTCRICSDEVGLTVEGELFVACNECAFPICRTCYEYERREGSQVCPQCKTRFKRLKGYARVDGDEEEDDIDDVENELNFEGAAVRHRGGQQRSLLESHLAPQVPLLADGHMADDDMPQDQLALVPSLAEVGDGSKRIHPLPPAPDPGLAVQPRPLDPSKDLAAYGYGSIAWKQRMKNWKHRQEKLQITNDEDPGSDNDDGLNLPLTDARQPLSRKLPIPSSQINPYRVIIIIRLLVLGFFFHYRVTHPVKDAYTLWLISVICELWFALSWILDQFPKWLPIDRETYLDRLSLRYEKAGKPSQLSAIDIFVSTVDPLKEPPLVTANTVLSILAVDYPADKVSCYVSDDGAAMLTFEALSETSEFAKRWVPFCKKFNIEPRAPEWYFAQKINYLKDKVLPSFVKERRAMKREYELFKVRINALVARARKVPEGGWTMQDGTPWPGNNARDHLGMIQVFLGQDEGFDIHGNDLPRLVYVSREKIPGFNHHKKAGAMNSLVRVSAVLTNAPYILNLDCDHYINNSKALREAMCFMMDPLLAKKLCYVQFPRRFDGIDKNDRYANQNTIFFDINMKGLDGIQGPIYVGTGCVFNRQALYGYDAPKPKKPHKCLPKNWCFGSSFPERKNGKKPSKPESQMKKKDMRDQVDAELPASPLMDRDDRIAEKEGDQSLALTPQGKLQKKFGQSPIFVASTLLENGGTMEGASTAALLQEAIHVISCGYEDKTEWGKEVGWIYGSVTEDILTGFKMHCRGWRSIYCMPAKPAFKGSAPINLSDRLHQVLLWASGSIEIFLSRHCPLWYGYGGGLKWLERLSYINATIYPLTSIPLLAYCTLPAVCLLTGKFIIPELNYVGGLWFLSLFICIFATSILEMRWSGVGIDEWWRNEQFWVIGGVSAHLFALFQGLLKVFAGVDTEFTVTSKKGDSDGDELSELYEMKWTTLLIPPTTLLMINLVGVLVGISGAMNDGYRSWGPLFGKLLFALWVILHLYPFLKGLMGRQSRTPTVVVVWSILLASIFSLLWIRVDPFLAKSDDPFLEECGLACD